MRILVIGGGSSLWDDLRTLRESGWEPHAVVACNDAGVNYPGHLDHWCSLHTKKLARWKADRNAWARNMDFVTWSHQYPALVDRTLSGWSKGSSGMLAVGVALAIGGTEVVLCGIPMTASPHYFDKAPWAACQTYRKGWTAKWDQMRGKVYSMSGWTRENLGAPPWIPEAGVTDEAA